MGCIPDWSHEAVLVAEPVSASRARDFVCLHLVEHNLLHRPASQSSSGRHRSCARWRKPVGADGRVSARCTARRQPRYASHRGCRAVRGVPGRGLRRVGATRCRRGLRAGLRHRAGSLDGPGPGRHVRARPDLRIGRLRWSTTATSTPATTTSRTDTCWATSPTGAPFWNWSPHLGRSPSETPSSTRCRSTADAAMSGSRATGAVRRTGSSVRRTAIPAPTTSAPGTSGSSGTSTSPCASWPISCGTTGTLPRFVTGTPTATCAPHPARTMRETRPGEHGDRAHPGDPALT